MAGEPLNPGFKNRGFFVSCDSMAKRKRTPKKVIKKATPKKVAKKIPSKKSPSLKTSSKRGSNIIKIHTGGKDPEKIAKKFTDQSLGKKLDYRIRKNKPVKGKGYKPPKAIITIFEVETEEGGTKVFSKISDPDFVVNKKNTLQFLKKQTENSNNEFEDFYGETYERVKSVSLKFIY